MEKYIVKLSYPVIEHRKVMENTVVTSIKVTEETDNIYSAVDWFEDNAFPKIKKQLILQQVKKRKRLKAVLNIHNCDGIRDVSQIRRMTRSISRGRHALARSGMPNVKIFKTKKNKYFLFDGHHSVLAYMTAGKRYLDSIPHLLIERSNQGRIIDADIYHFFGGLLAPGRGLDWLKYTVNWQAPKKKQLCPRLQKNMGEVFDRIELI